MDFRLTEEQKKRREEFFQVCRDLEARKPVEHLGFESNFDGHDKNWEYYMLCRKEFARQKWTTLNWPAEYGGHGTMMDRVFLAEALGYHHVPGLEI